MVALTYRSKAELAAEHIRAQIQQGELKAGDRVVVDQVASTLGTSKVPVREAVTRLVGEGLLQLFPNIGPVVPRFTADDVTETAILRLAVEEAALRIAVAEHTSETLQAARAILASMEEPGADFPELNVVFHCALMQPAAYPYLLHTVESLLRRTQRFNIVFRVPGYRNVAHDEHAAILDAIEKRDLDQVLELNRHHVQSAADRLSGFLEGEAPNGDARRVRGSRV